METSNGFRDEYRFLSNFWPLETPIVYQGRSYATTEHFYQAMKFCIPWMRDAVSEHPMKGLKGFVEEQEDFIRLDWDEIKLQVMEFALRHKFSDLNPNLRQKLIDTIGVELIEYNSWNDIFWGVGLKSKIGRNELGKLLMKIREELWLTRPESTTK